MKKQVLAFSLAATMLLAAGCSNEPSNSSSMDSAPSESSASNTSASEAVEIGEITLWDLQNNKEYGDIMSTTKPIRRHLLTHPIMIPML